MRIIAASKAVVINSVDSIWVDICCMKSRCNKVVDLPCHCKVSANTGSYVNTVSSVPVKLLRALYFNHYETYARVNENIIRRRGEAGHLVC